jgi:hypothetical protein
MDKEDEKCYTHNRWFSISLHAIIIALRNNVSSR